jgi:glucose-6-phosphate 1-dehydrogenase
MPHTIIIFGASGDLTRRKLIPALYRLHAQNRLPDGTRIVGFSRTTFSHDEWRTKLAESTKQFIGDEFDADTWTDFASRVYYSPGDIGSSDDFVSLAKLLDEVEQSSPSDRIYYLSTAPRFYEPAVEQLGASGLADEQHSHRRIVIEKPFGVDLESAQRLNEAVHRVFAERQVFRIDHYLGKETVQNLLVLRFANTIFEPIWNRNYIDHVQITVAEKVTVGDRAGYFDTAGVLRDMIQNHLLQLMMFTAMEAPSRFQADLVRDEKAKVLRAIRPLDTEMIAQRTVRGQYRDYRDEPDVATHSNTATFAAVKLAVDNWRWQGVPFYLRTGKAMSCRTTQIVIQFRQPPHMMFGPTSRSGHDANRLVLQVQPAEGIQMHFLTKAPDAGMKLRMTDLDFNYQQEFSRSSPEAYQRLLLDALEGDASLFARSDEVELAWSIVDPIQQAWDTGPKPSLAFYEHGDWGPSISNDWMQEQGRQWFDSCPVLH